MIAHILFAEFPAVTIEPPTLRKSIGKKATFECQATGSPAPSVVWSRPGVENWPHENVTIDGSTLDISYLKAEDAGSYACTATSSVGTASATAMLECKLV